MADALNVASDGVVTVLVVSQCVFPLDCECDLNVCFVGILWVTLCIGSGAVIADGKDVPFAAEQREPDEAERTDAVLPTAVWRDTANDKGQWIAQILGAAPTHFGD